MLPLFSAPKPGKDVPDTHATFDIASQCNCFIWEIKLSNKTTGDPAKTIVASQFTLAKFAGHEVILDLRNDANEFLSSVNDIQIGMIRNRRCKKKMSHFGWLPLAAKKYVKNKLAAYLQDLKDRGAKDTLKNLDIACWRQMLLTGETRSPSAIRKRRESGFFVILPLDDIPIAIERGNFTPSYGNFSYWRDIQAEAERLRPPESLENADPRDEN
jgi:hypothetical protein